MTATNLWNLVPVLAVAYAVVMAGAVLGAGWRLLTDRKPSRSRRGAVVPSGGGTGQGSEGTP
ncbi:MAG: hypothetical protein ACRDSP_19960 [Pseudonocardiaceae bacterium]